MTFRQNILRLFYPLFSAFRKATSGNKLVNVQNTVPVVSFYSLSIELNKGDTLPFEKLRGKKVLVVNTASDCGFTAQYAELQKLYELYHDRLEIIGFPSNDFKQQEKGTDEQIQKFCTENFGITFPLVKKSIVSGGSDQNKIYNWLTSKEKNGWNNQLPQWNFAKYLINEKGVLTHYFDSSVSPVDMEVLKAVKTPAV
jgi:glutathione peroxidase